MVRGRVGEVLAHSVRHVARGQLPRLPTDLSRPCVLELSKNGHTRPVSDDSHDNRAWGRTRRMGAAVLEAARRVDQAARLLTMAKALRESLPGDSKFGDPGRRRPHRFR
jgi:hypothetical protein